LGSPYQRIIITLARGGVADVADAYASGQASKPFLDGTGLQFRHKFKAFVSVEFAFIVREETVRLVATVVLGAETPVNVWENGLVLEAFCAKDTAAYSGFPSSATGNVENKGVYQLLVHFRLKSMVIFALFDRNFCTA
jgi:hypothetical protein